VQISHLGFQRRLVEPRAGGMPPTAREPRCASAGAFFIWGCLLSAAATLNAQSLPPSFETGIVLADGNVVPVAGYERGRWTAVWDASSDDPAEIVGDVWTRRGLTIPAEWRFGLRAAAHRAALSGSRGSASMNPRYLSCSRRVRRGCAGSSNQRGVAPERDR
jgi:hypothetical protein